MPRGRAVAVARAAERCCSTPGLGGANHVATFHPVRQPLHIGSVRLPVRGETRDCEHEVDHGECDRDEHIRRAIAGADCPLGVCFLCGARWA